MPGEDKTEQATPQHRQDARKKGQVAKSMDLVSALVLLAGLASARWVLTGMGDVFTGVTRRYLGGLASAPDTQAGVMVVGMDCGLVFFRLAGPVLGATLLASMVANVGQVGLMLAGEAMKPDLTRLDPIKGFGRMLSTHGLVEVFKGLAKAAIVAWVVWVFMRNELPAIISLSSADADSAGRTVTDLIWRLCLRTAMVLAVIAGLDYLYQRFQFDKNLRMTKQEVKDETRRSEGDPVIKSAFRQRHRELARSRMMAAVPNADVVVTNPTHLAIALKYDPALMHAPQVVAKGQRLVAQRIKELALAAGVPIVENKPIAQLLFKSADVGDPVPVDLYHAVAEILAFVFRHKRSPFAGTA